jgi:hypothetical protein
VSGRAAALMQAVGDWLRGDADAASPVTECQTLAAQVAERRRMDREHTLARTAAGTMDPELANENLAAMRWLDSAVYHVWRAAHHLAVPDPLASAAAPL